MNIKKKHIIIISVTIVLIIGILITIPLIIKRELNKKIEQFNSTSGFTFTSKVLDVQGLSEIVGDEIKIKKSDTISVIQIKALEIELSPIKYLFGGNVISKLQISGVIIDIGEIVSKSQKDSTQLKNIPDNSPKSTNKLQRALRFIPATFSADSLDIFYIKGKDTLGLFVEFLKREDNAVSSSLRMYSNSNSTYAGLEGLFGDNMMNIKLKPKQDSLLEIPFVKVFENSYLAFDSISLSGKIISDTVFRFKENMSLYNTRISNFRLSNELVTVPFLSGTVDLGFSDSHIYLNDSSYFQINKLKVYPTFSFAYRKPYKLSCSFKTGVCSAQSIIESFPPKLFSNLDGLQLKGNVDISMNSEIDFAIPDSLKFEMNVESHDLEIIKYGKTNLALMSGDFNHAIYENGHFMKQILVSYNNPNYVRIDTISKFLQASVMTAEDGQFFTHKGFIGDSFRHALIQNIKAGRFVRGGSTISQQLIKNVFLNRNKTIFRKLEEAMIVWLIEELRLTSKKRMFEVYLNIIEWAPGIYGIKDASEFYFDKHPSQLNLSESIYLTSLVPKPKKFKYSFDKDGTLRDHYDSYYQLIVNHLLISKQIDSTDTTGLKMIATLPGKAWSYIDLTDTTLIESDSLANELIIPEIKEIE